ncbi:uncharacterized protein LOC116341054 [Contarinia nasturtii]|uniref:uncharacterized protein LOC116341054 n=1 Tax=Contarinia nasturtii TaxID=265458 RepID=UPI0012D4166E|nr:uncharacterized protein LOC116341054 [Contarinia nasturtii]
MSHSVEPIAKRLRQRIKTVESKTAKNKKRTNQLLALNDDCLYAVFQNLNIESLCHTANVCKRMRSVAEQVFHRYFRNSCFVVDENQYQWSMSPENSNYMSGNIINKTVLRRILCKFGHLMTTFDPVIGFYDHLGIKCDDILKYSSENLNHLRLRGITISSEELAPIMPRLKFLGLNDCEIDYPEVLMHHFPKLKHLDLRYTNIRPDTLANILRLNPQLKYLEMRGLNDSEFISVITENAKDLEKLKFEFCYGWKPRDDHVNDILLFSKLKKLKVFEFIQVKYASIAKSGKLLIKSFANENIAIEELSLGGFSFDADDITNLANQKALRYLFVSKVKQMNDSDLEFTIEVTITEEFGRNVLNYRSSYNHFMWFVYNGEVWKVERSEFFWVP